MKVRNHLEPSVQIDVVDYEDSDHRAQVIALWRTVFAYDAVHNAPGLAIDKKVAVDDGLFFVALADGDVIGTVMAGYDGHRGWVYSMAVHPDWRGDGLGSQLLAAAEEALAARGCVKINLQVLPGNGNAQAFYEANGYVVEDRISMGKRLLT
jgi:ribosomal protein S18 acetylase RimI-like enzyme